MEKPHPLSTLDDMRLIRKKRHVSSIYTLLIHHNKKKKDGGDMRAGNVSVKPGNAAYFLSIFLPTLFVSGCVPSVIPCLFYIFLFHFVWFFKRKILDNRNGYFDNITILQLS